jgi:hypothetical protein
MMARQIALLEHTYYARVKAAHLIKAAFVNQSARENASVQWTEHTNMFGRWIATRILRQPSKSLRGKMISRFITLAEVWHQSRSVDVLLTLLDVYDWRHIRRFFNSFIVKCY